jgi:glycosyltransferase involved in cell wall biosynthesis
MSVPKRSTRVSLCMVCANSEDTLPRFFRWAVPRFAEIVVVRSESQDATDAIVAEQVRAHPGQIRDYFRKIDDITHQKQHCVDRATRSWRLVIDADELIEDTDWDHLVAQMDAVGCDMGGFPRYNLQVDDQHYCTDWYPDVQARLFNRRVYFNKEPRYQTHHRMDGARGGKVFHELHILHWGNIRPSHQLAWKSKMRAQYAATDYIEGKELASVEDWFSERNRTLDTLRAPLPEPVAATVRAWR